MADFFEKFRISSNEVMESVYNRPFPNRFPLNNFLLLGRLHKR